MRSLFSTFPRGWPAAGLLILRSVVGLTALVEGARLAIASDGWVATTVGILAFAVGVAVLVGFLTLFASALVCGAAMAALLGWAPAARLSPLVATYIAALSLALLMAGPGAISVDALLFGRREIVVSGTPRSRS